MPRLTIREWFDAHPGEDLDGRVVLIPAGPYRANLPPGMANMKVRGLWGMGETRGLWVSNPGMAKDRLYPVFNVPVDEFLSWEVVE